MTFFSKFRLGWLFILVFVCAGLAAGQSLDSGLPSAQIDSNVSSTPMVQNTAGEDVNAAYQPSVQNVIPNSQINSDAVENPNLPQGENATSALSSATVQFSSSIAGWSQRTYERGMQASQPNRRLSMLSRGNYPRALRGMKRGTQRLDKEAVAINSGKLQARGEHRATTDGTLPVTGISTLQDDSALCNMDFSDSTRTPTLASSPDPGTKSPLAWNPGLNAGLKDLQNSQFLNPSLHARVTRQRRRRTFRTSKAAPSNPSSLLNQDLNPELGPQLGNTLNQPVQDPLSSVDQQLSPQP